MGIFNSIDKTKKSKKLYNFNLQEIYRKGRFANPDNIDYEFFEDLYTKKLLDSNTKSKNTDLIQLWAKLEMKSYIDYDLGNTLNLYYSDGKFITVKELEDYNYMPEDARKMNLLDIKHTRKINIADLEFQNIYLATFEIIDTENFYRPYILLFKKDENNKWIQIGYGYDSNNNGNVELFIKTFNYPIFLTNKGHILAPLSNKKIKINVYDYINENTLKKLLEEQKRHD